MAVFSIGERLHVVEKRMFADDVRRHFVGEIVSFTENAIRIVGYVWVYNAAQARYVRREEKRERIIVLGDRIVMNILPRHVEIKDIVYNTDNIKRMFITDGKKFSLEMSEFVSV